MEGDWPGTSHRPFHQESEYYTYKALLSEQSFLTLAHTEDSTTLVPVRQKYFWKLRITSCWSQAKKYRFDFSTKILRNMRIIVHWVVNVFSSHSIHIQIYSLQASCQLYKKYFIILLLFFASRHYFFFCQDKYGFFFMAYYLYSIQGKVNWNRTCQ